VPDDRHAFLTAVETYIERADQHDLEVLMDVLEAVLSDRLESYEGFVQASVRGLRDAIRRAHGAPGRPR
jgi:hypothetical protein